MMAEEEKKEQKKIIIDEDWKEQARKEKEVMIAKERAERQKEEKTKRRGPMPPGDFEGLVSMLATQTMLAMGALVPEGQQKKEPDLELAKYHIDMLEALEAKTNGNLSKQESEMLNGTLHQLRILYVKVTE